jgi:hypothetical protein
MLTINVAPAKVAITQSIETFYNVSIDAKIEQLAKVVFDNTNILVDCVKKSENSNYVNLENRYRILENNLIFALTKITDMLHISYFTTENVDSFKTLQSMVKICKVSKKLEIPVSDSYHPVFINNETNRLMRCVHDCIHLCFNLDFSTESETKVGIITTLLVASLSVNSDAINYTLIDNVGNTLFYEQKGNFPAIVRRYPLPNLACLFAK